MVADTSTGWPWGTAQDGNGASRTAGGGPTPNDDDAWAMAADMLGRGRDRRSAGSGGERLSAIGAGFGVERMGGVWRRRPACGPSVSPAPRWPPPSPAPERDARIQVD
jgi:hypothetical protein